MYYFRHANLNQSRYKGLQHNEPDGLYFFPHRKDGLFISLIAKLKERCSLNVIYFVCDSDMCVKKDHKLFARCHRTFCGYC